MQENGIECVEGERECVCLCMYTYVYIYISEYTFIGIDWDFAPAGVMQKNGIECAEGVCIALSF